MSSDEKASATSPPAVVKQSPKLPQIQPPPASDSQQLTPDPLSRPTFTMNPVRMDFLQPNGPMTQGIPTEGPATHPDGPPSVGELVYATPPLQIAGGQVYFHPQHPPQPLTDSMATSTPPPPQPPAPTLPTSGPLPQVEKPGSKPPSDDLAPNADELYNRASQLFAAAAAAMQTAEQSGAVSAPGPNHYPSSSGVRLPPILQVEKQQVTTSATQAASASRRRNEAHFQCPVPGCGSTFTRRFNLRGHLRSHTEERPYICEWPGCKKGFARQHDCKRHQALHTAKSQSNICLGCKKTFSRLDALNRHLRSEGGADCRPHNPKFAQASEDDRIRQQQQQQAHLQQQQQMQQHAALAAAVSMVAAAAAASSSAGAPPPVGLPPIPLPLPSIAPSALEQPQPPSQ